jgi:hypothetical protein
MLTLGLESSSQAILDGVRKGLKVEDGVRAAQAIRRAEALRRQAFVEFYFRPEVVWANLRRMKLREVIKRLDFRNWMKG